MINKRLYLSDFTHTFPILSLSCLCSLMSNTLCLAMSDDGLTYSKIFIIEASVRVSKFSGGKGGEKQRKGKIEKLLSGNFISGSAK